ncbi:DUF6338 family protein [Leptospira noguchii]|uniref:DUF6338 family protein n=1 Tax=Leptospira noguchii TaxID=28182 RepID=UPI0003284583|nr:DUF6338 family protein [Leptospira noguchii]EMS83478.1 hypothetical protein LEP1GSC073_2789 [Leptospira noguchii str. Cascata]UOG37035.1 DUF6338 family protein [Leptospira noguchii]
MEFIKEVKPESVLIACLFIFPGFITIKISRLIHVQKDSPLAELIVDAAFYTIINYIVNSFLILYFFETQTTTLCKIIIAIWTLILFPAFLPFISSFLLKTQFIRRFTNVDPIPKPWDYYFAQKRPAWIIIHLKNGKKIGGYYGNKSFASSYPHDEQLYIEEVWRISKKGNFKKKINRSNGLIVDMNEISSIEFFET